MKKLKYWIEYAAVRILEAVVKAPPLSTALRWGEALGTGLGKILGKRDRLIVANLSAAFPEKSSQEIRRITDAVWKNIGRVAVEFIRSREILGDPIGSAAAIDNPELVRQAAAEGKGIIFVAGHFCNWEFNGIIVHELMKTTGRGFKAIARPMRNPRTEAWVQAHRAEGGIPIILHRQAVRESLRALRAGDSIAILFDQNLYTGGVFVNFFGRPAATTTLPALLHSRTGAPVILGVPRREHGRFAVRYERIDLPQAPEDQRLVVWTQLINDRLEAAVRARPEWWFWIHNRWKRSQEAVPAPAAAKPAVS